MSAQDVIEILRSAILHPTFRGKLFSDPDWLLDQFSLTAVERKTIRRMLPHPFDAPTELTFGIGGAGDLPPVNPDVSTNPGPPDGASPKINVGGSEGEYVPCVQPSDPSNPIPCVQPTDKGDINPCFQPGEEGGINPCWKPGDEGGINPCWNPGDEGAYIPCFQPDGGGGSNFLPAVQRLLLLLLGLGGLIGGLLLFAPSDMLGGLLGPLDALGCTGVETPQQSGGLYSPSQIILVSYSLQAPDASNSFAGFFDALNRVRAMLGQSSIPYDKDCAKDNSSSGPDSTPDTGGPLGACFAQCSPDKPNCQPGLGCLPRSDGTFICYNDACASSPNVTEPPAGETTCRCDGTTLICTDGTVAEFNPACGVGGGQCTANHCGNRVCDCGEDRVSCLQDCQP